MLNFYYGTAINLNDIAISTVSVPLPLVIINCNGSPVAWKYTFEVLPPTSTVDESTNCACELSNTTSTVPNLRPPADVSIAYSAISPK